MGILGAVIVALITLSAKKAFEIIIDDKIPSKLINDFRYEVAYIEGPALYESRLYSEETEFSRHDVFETDYPEVNHWTLNLYKNNYACLTFHRPIKGQPPTESDTHYTFKNELKCSKIVKVEDGEYYFRFEENLSLILLVNPYEKKLKVEVAIIDDVYKIVGFMVHWSDPDRLLNYSKAN